MRSGNRIYSQSGKYNLGKRPAYIVLRTYCVYRRTMKATVGLVSYL